MEYPRKREYVKTIWEGKAVLDRGFFPDASFEFNKAREAWCLNDNMRMVIKKGLNTFELRSYYFRDELDKIFERYGADGWIVTEIKLTKLKNPKMEELWK